MKKLTAIVLVLILGMTSLLACGMDGGTTGKDGDTSSDSQTIKKASGTKEGGAEKMGRYVEKEVALPDIFKDITPHILQGKEKAIELYAFKTDGENACTYYKLGGEGKWKKGSAPFRFTTADQSEYGTMERLVYGQDEFYYAVVRKNEAPVLLKLQEDQKPEKIPMEGWDQSTKAGDSNYFQYPSVQILQSGYVLVSESIIGTALFTNKGKKVEDLSKDNVECCTWGKNAAWLDWSQNVIQLVDGTKGNALSTLKIEENSDYKYLIEEGPDGNLYLADASGLHRIQEGGSKWETLMDGSLLSFAVPSMFFASIQFGSDQDYYVDYQNDEEKHTYIHYVYDETISATPHQTLSIYSLKESKSVRTAAVLFQRSHPDVKIDYRAPMSNNSAADQSDCIQALNAELLAKKGADILICDQLPSDSYMEKGILQDLSSVIDPLVQKGELLENVISNSEKDGKLYVVPARMAPILLLGKNDALANAGSMADLAAYAKQQKGGIPLFKNFSYGELASTLFALQQNQLTEADGTLNCDKMVVFLEQVKQISEQSQLTAEESEESERNSKRKYNLVSSLVDQTGQLGIYAAGKVDNIMEISALKKQGIANYQLAFQAYEPKVEMAVTQASKQKELAYEFIKAMLDQGLQRESFDDGVPIQTGAILEWNSIVKPIMGSMTTKKNAELVMEWPTAKQIQEWTSLFSKVTQPVTLTGSVYEEAVAEQFTAMMEGKLDSSACADAILNQMKTYLNE